MRENAREKNKQIITLEDKRDSSSYQIQLFVNAVVENRNKAS